MLNMLQTLDGLSSLTEWLLNSWVQPVFILIVGATSILLLKDKKMRELLIFAIFAAIVGVFVFLGDDIFGGNRGLTGVAKKAADKVNVAQVYIRK